MSEQNQTTNEVKPKTVKQEYIELMNVQPDIVDFTYYEFLKNRKIILNEDIGDTILEKVTLQIEKFNQEDDDLGLSIEERQPIVIKLSSYGGSVYEGMALVDEILNSKTPVHIEVKGIAASMGALILMAGHVRKMTKHSVVLIHDGSMFIGGTTSKVKDHVRFQDEREKQIKDFVLDRTKITPEKYDEQYQKEWYLVSEDALKFGVVDEIL